MVRIFPEFVQTGLGAKIEPLAIVCAHYGLLLRNVDAANRVFMNDGGVFVLP
jgi:hypothetical protein